MRYAGFGTGASLGWLYGFLVTLLWEWNGVWAGGLGQSELEPGLACSACDLYIEPVSAVGHRWDHPLGCHGIILSLIK